MFCLLFFFFNDTATTEIYTLSLHDALPILMPIHPPGSAVQTWKSNGWSDCTEPCCISCKRPPLYHTTDRKSTRLNSSHQIISYAVFCLKKKIPRITYTHPRSSEHSVTIDSN